ncbi:MAG: sterol desaturase family protein [Pseudomonadota bacterium]
MLQDIYLSSGPGFPTLLFLAVLAVIASRYFIFAGIAFAGLFVFRRRLASRRIQNKTVTRKQMWRELGWSIASIPVIALTAVLYLWAHSTWGILQFYSGLLDYGWLWLIVSMPIAVLIHDFYFYWMHRLVHVTGIFEVVHKVHHGATNPTPLSSFAFHPIEAVLEAFGILIVALIIPVHPVILLALALYLQATNAMLHLGYEIFPRHWVRHPVLRYLNTPTNHNQHHSTFRYNFGLYTLIWDRLFGTLHPEYEALYERVTENRMAEGKSA